MGGAVEFIDLFYHTSSLSNFLAFHRENNWEIVGTDIRKNNKSEENNNNDKNNDDNDNDVNGGNKILIIGSEDKGVSMKLKRECTRIVTIEKPRNNRMMETTVDSLNAGVACGILLSKECNN